LTLHVGLGTFQPVHVANVEDHKLHRESYSISEAAAAQINRALVEKRLYPAIQPLQTATRREDLLYHPDEWERVQVLRKAMAALPPIEAMETLISNLQATKTNAELLLSGLK